MEPAETKLAKFDPDDFDAHEDAFLNLLAQSYGVLKEPLRYVVRPEEEPDEFANNEEEHMYQFPLEGDAFELDNKTIYRKLKAFLIDSPGWAWIEPHDTAKDGRAAFMAWTNHYNGQGELSKCTALAKSKLDSIYYKNEQQLSFERCTEMMTKCFNTLHKDPDQRFSDRQKVEKLLKAIKTSDSELSAAKAVIDMSFPRDFVGACGYFSQQVARIHGPAQLEYRHSKGRKRGIYAVNRTQTRGGRGRGRYGGCNNNNSGRGHSGHGQQNSRRIVVNGIDITDPNRNFSQNEWEALRRNGGHQIVLQMREQSPEDRAEIVMETAIMVKHKDVITRTEMNEMSEPSALDNNAEEDRSADQGTDNQSSGNTDRGGRNGRGFGCGAYLNSSGRW